MRKLVELDPVTSKFLEVDKMRLKREAHMLKDYILTIPPEKDKFDYRGQVLPIVEEVLNDTLELPYRGYEPYNWEIREGLLSREFLKVYSPFMNTAVGAHRVIPQIVVKDGKQYAWNEFEEEGMPIPEEPSRWREEVIEVEKDKDGGYFTKAIDIMRLKKAAQMLREYIISIAPENDNFGFREKTLPYCDGVLADQMPLPLIGAHPYEGKLKTLPLDYVYVHVGFFTLAAGIGHFNQAEVYERDGKLWVKAKFET